MSLGVVIVNIILLIVVAGVLAASIVSFTVIDPDPLWGIALMLSVIAAQLLRIANKT